MVARLPKYRRGIRPVQPESLPAFIDTELSKLESVIAAQAEIIRDLSARLAALEPSI